MTTRAPASPKVLSSSIAVDGRVRLVHAGGHDDPLASSETVGLDHDRRATLRDERLGGVRVLERSMQRRRNVVPDHEGLGEVLGRFELRRGASRPEDAQAGFAKRVDHARSERRLRADHRQIDAFLLREGDELGHPGDGDVLQPVFRCRTAVARGDENLLHFRAVEKPPGEGVLASARADDEQFHVNAGSDVRP